MYMYMYYIIILKQVIKFISEIFKPFFAQSSSTFQVNIHYKYLFIYRSSDSRLWNSNISLVIVIKINKNACSFIGIASAYIRSSYRYSIFKCPYLYIHMPWLYTLISYS